MINGGDVAMTPAPPLDWKFSQVFGERAAGEEIQEVDIISATEFDKTGDHLATGDRGGRVVLFERINAKQDDSQRRDAESMDCSSSRHPEFCYKTEFQGHEPEFDYLKSLEIEEKINKIRWCQPVCDSQYLLTTNDKTIKLWKVTTHETSIVARCRRTYAHAHEYHVNSISNNSDGETFISADDLRINLWNLGYNSQSFNIVDVKPANMEDLTEVITSAEFHPSHCNTLAYSSSKGLIRLIDLRQSALCDTHCKLFEENSGPGSKSFFADIIASISDIKFTKDGRHMLSHDYMTLKLWDMKMDSGPVATFHVHDYLRPKLCDLNDNDSIFDKFECCVSGDGLRSATGSYSNRFRVFGCSQDSREATTLEATKTPMRRQVQTPTRPMQSDATPPCVVRRDNSGVNINGTPFDYTTKLLHLAWHPTENSLACAASNSLYMYYA